MTNILSQEEIDALLGGLTTGSVKSATRAKAIVDPSQDVIPFNFVNQDRIVRGGMPTLEVVHDRFARLLRSAMMQTVRRSVDVQVLDHAELKFGEFCRSLTRPSSLHIMRLEPLSGLGLLALPGKLIYTMMDIFFGGTGVNSEKKDARDFTLIEQRMIATLTDIVDRHYTEAWIPVYPLQVECGGSETNPQFLNVAQTSDTVTAVDYEITIEDIQCGLSVCLPYSTIEPIKDTLKGSVISDKMDQQNAWTQRMSEQLRKAVIEMRAMLGSVTISVSDLLYLRKGDVLQLREDYEHPVEVLIEGVPKFWGTVGSHKSARAIQITAIHEDARKDD